MTKSPELALYRSLLGDIKTRVRRAQHRAALSANAEMILMYWDIGSMIAARQAQEGWGAGVIPRLAVDLRNELPEQKGFSERNLGYMIRFAREYGDPPIPQRPAAGVPLPAAQTGTQRDTAGSEAGILQQAAAKSEEPSSLRLPPGCLFGIPWFHHVILIQKVKDLPTRLWYAQKTLEHGWSRDTLTIQIKNRAHERQGAAITNFATTLPDVHADLAQQLLKDPYLFDFLTLEDPFHERELETGLLGHIQKFLLELGRGFAFVGRQYLLEVGDKQFYLDLLFYLPRLPGDLSVRTEKREGGIVVDYAADGRPIGIEITSPHHVSLAIINQIISGVDDPASFSDLSPLGAVA